MVNSIREPARLRYNRAVRRHRHFVLSAGLALAGLAVTAAEPTFEPATAIWSPQARVPLAAAGTGFAPTADVKLAVDARGKVTSVEVLSVRPSSRFDEEFREEIVSRLSAWRFAPARRDGNPVDTELQFQLRFAPREPDSASEEILAPRAHFGGGGSTWWEPGLSSTREWWERRLRGLSPREREEWTRTHVAAAEKGFVADRRATAIREPFRVTTDAPNPAVAQTVAGNLGATWRALDALFAEAIPPVPDPRPIHVFVFSSRAGFQSVANEFGMAGTEGFWISTGILAFHLELPSSEHANAVLIHEATHAYASRRLLSPVADLPLWLSEGLAEYVSHSQIREGRIVPGSHERYRLYHAPGAVWRERAQGEIALEEVRQAIESGSAPGIADLTGSPSKWFQGADAALAYAQSWLLVHFLRHGEEGWEKKEFPTFLLYVAEGFPVLAALRDVYGLDERSLERRWREYTARF